MAGQGCVVSRVRESLREQLSRFDDDAFVAMANRGLLRRAYKDMETSAPEIESETPDNLVVVTGGRRVTFDARGPAHARCDCPAAGICQHVLAASLGLRTALDEPEPGSGVRDDAKVVDETTAPPLEVLGQVLLGFSQAALLAHAGKAGYRWAWQFAQDLNPERDIRVDGDRHILITIRAPRMSFRFMGGGLDAVVGDSPQANAAKYQLAAVLAFRRSMGMENPLPAGAARSAPLLQLGKDHAPASASGEELEVSRIRLREAVKRLLQECVGLGLSHLSPTIAERFNTLATWAQGAEYYRLAMAMRRLGDQVDWLLERSGGADEQRLFDEMAWVTALVDAIDNAAVRGERPGHLVGSARTRYSALGSLEMVGLGASSWRSGSGYVGLTMLFWSSGEGFMTCTDARPEWQGGFNARERYRQAGPWSGLGSPSLATGRRVVLTGAQASGTGRVSASASTSASVFDDGVATRLAALTAADDWKVLASERGEARRSLLADADPIRDWVFLRPSRVGLAVFDEAAQRLAWPLHDVADRELVATVTWSEHGAHAIDRIERIEPTSWSSGDVVVARLRDDAAGIVAEPLAIVRRSAAVGTPVVDALHFDAGPESREIHRRDVRAPGVDVGVTASPRQTVVPTALRNFDGWMLQQAERGLGDAATVLVAKAYDAHASRLRDIGFNLFAGLVDHAPMPAKLLRARYLSMQYRRLLGGAGDDSGDAPV